MWKADGIYEGMMAGRWVGKGIGEGWAERYGTRQGRVVAAVAGWVLSRGRQGVGGWL